MRLPVAANRVFRIALTTALALAAAYGLSMPLPFLAPLLALMLSASPAPPPRLKGLAGLILLVLITMGLGLILIPVFINYPVSAFLIVALGLYGSAYVSVVLGKGPVGALLTVGLTMIPAAGTVDFGLALAVVQALVAGIGLAVLCQWLVYPWFPEQASPTVAASQSEGTGFDVPPSWIALRTALVVLPPFFLLLVNPAMYMPIIMKTVLLGQQASVMHARAAGRELLGSTFLAGCFAIFFWFGLKVCPSLWMFWLWMLLFGLYFGSKLYGVLPSRYPPSFWQNVAVTMLILLGPAVEDSSSGKDVYEAFAVRMGLFLAVALYAWAAVLALESLRRRNVSGPDGGAMAMEARGCS